jgi:hypothetical protein
MIFEKASRLALRFVFRGTIGVEDVWNLTLSELDSIYKELKKKQKDSTEGLLQRKNTEDEKNDLRLQIVEHIFNVKKAELEVAKQAQDRKMQREKILNVIATKKDADLHNRSLEDLQKMVDEMGE